MLILRRGVRRKVALAITLTACVLGPLANARASDRPKQVLVLNSTRPDDQFSIVWARELPKRLAEGLEERVDFYIENLDFVRFPTVEHARQAEALSSPPTSLAAPTRTVVSTNAGRDENQVAGAMVAVKGSCPVMTFSVAGTMIWMDSTTVLNGLSCGQLVNGTIVRVNGLRRQDGSILASAISAPQL